MRRADRLSEIIQLLRRMKLARARDLMASGVPVEGEAGVGYILRGGDDLPPRMFDKQEFEALVLGVRIVETWADAELADAELAEAAGNVIAKVAAVIPERLRRHIAETVLPAPPDHYAAPLSIDPGELRRADNDRPKVRFRYRDLKDRDSERTVPPLALAFYGPIWLLASRCELRRDFRSFRFDRISELTILRETCSAEPGMTIQDFLKRDTE